MNLTIMEFIPKMLLKYHTVHTQTGMGQFTKISLKYPVGI